MSDANMVLVGMIVAVVAVLLFTYLRWLRSRSARAVMHGLGVALAIGGLYLLGFLDLVLQWAKATVHWARALKLDQLHLIGVIVGGAGVVFFLIGSLISPVSRAEAKQRRLARKEAGAALPPSNRPGSGVAANPAASAKAAAPVKNSKAAPAANSAEDDEIEAILRNHGIS